MLGLVKTALQKPYTFIVLAIFICIIGPMAALRTPTDVFPDIGIPVGRRGLAVQRPVPGRHGRPGDLSPTAHTRG